MDWNFEKILRMISNKGDGGLLLDGRFGLEKESVRITQEGDMALTDHPAVFGDKFTNPYITTDFSESQIEIITPPLATIDETYKFLVEKQLEVENGLEDELLWPLSMPPRLPEEDKIPIAKFQSGKKGSEKEIYRNGLALRYGKKMQLISGIHYNYSLGEKLIDFLHDNFDSTADKDGFKNQLYLILTRNYLRYRWLLIYLFGASPAADRTYDPVIFQELRIVRKCCPECCTRLKDYKRYAVSLRVSRFGYSSALQRKYTVSYNSLVGYINDIRTLLATKSRKYERLEIYKSGTQLQLNSNVLQRDSEYYSSVRFKQTLEENETQIDALEKRGIKYIELRILDLNPYEKTGVGLNQLRFMHVFVLYCLFSCSELINPEEYQIINANHHAAALFGRRDGLKLNRTQGGLIPLRDWSSEIFKDLKAIAWLIDEYLGEELYVPVIDVEYEKVMNAGLLPSSKIISEMAENDESFIDFGVRRALINKNICREVLNAY
ncbi:MAG: glutamate--cysteine ligase [Bacillota bacterium]|nr:glutamate--cysteine ligase [Bacillota bacterium]